jgi:hypothetical protein
MPRPASTPKRSNAQPKDSSDGAGSSSKSRPAPCPSAVVLRLADRVRPFFRAGGATGRNVLAFFRAGGATARNALAVFAGAADRVGLLVFPLVGAPREGADELETTRLDTATIRTTLTPAT